MQNNIKTALLSCGREFTYRHEIRPKLKNIYISIGSDKTVLLKSPAVSEKVILSVIERRAEWIFKHLSIKRERYDTASFENGSLIPLFGKQYPLSIIENKFAPIGTCVVYISNNIAKAEVNPCLFKEEFFYKALDRLYQDKAREIILPILESRASEMGLLYRKVTFRKTKGRWGSCTTAGSISLNYELAKLPYECADYVCVHELAHLAHPNHGAGFWKLVSEYVPDYLRIRKFMKSCILGFK